MFINLHAHSEYSLLDGAGTPIQRAERARELKQEALSLSDHGNLMGIPHHIEACNNEGIKPICAVEAYFKPDRNLKDVENRKAWHLLLIAKNEDGWKNLMKIITESHLTGFYHKPCLDYELLEKFGGDLICSSACVTGYVPWLIQEGREPEVHDAIEKHLQIFGEDYRLEIMPHDFPAQKVVNIKLANLAQDYNIPLLATADSHYPYKEWKDTQDILLMIATGQSLSKRIAKKDEGEEVYKIDTPLHMFSEDEIGEMFVVSHPDLHKDIVVNAINETKNISDQVEPFEIDTSNKVPRAAKTKEESYSILVDWCREGMERIGKLDDDVYTERLTHELKTLQDMDVVDYFVIVGKMVRWAREQGIRISSGRGSAAGSLVCYLIKITTIDPVAYDLLFERFLNPNRKGLPDIDLDFEAERRDEVKAWLAEEYGTDRVANIVALSTYGPKGALKDVGRVMDVPFSTLNIITRAIPEAGDVGGAANVPPLETLRTQYGVIDQFSQEFPEVWKHALRVEGHVKGISQHAGGVVLTDKPIVEYMPLMQGKSGIVTAWSDSASFPAISKFGLLKIDILSLDGLSKQGNTIRFIENKYGKKINLDDLEIAHNPEAVDQDVMRLFQKGQTLGIFQFGGSRGITNFLRHVKPDRFEDLIASNALYRPGPLEGGDAFKYGDLKQGKIPVEYWDESIIPILEKTYGVMVYQEQLQQIAQVLGNFSPSESDDLRKIASKIYRMGKAKAEEAMKPYKEQWIKGTRENNIDQELAEEIWAKMLGFAQYSFNRSHAASYSLAAYQDAWLKTNYPLGFYASLLTIEDKPEEIIREARSRDITVAPPDVNLSEAGFTVSDDKLLYGLLRVNYIGDVSANHIIENRPYKSLKDFREKTIKAKADKRVVDNLISGGAFDSLGEREGWTTEEKRDGEIKALKVALSGVGDSAKYANIIEDRINTEEDIERIYEGKSVTLGGEIVSVKHHIIKSGKNKGKKMGYVEVMYKDNSWSCTLFKKQYEQYVDMLKSGEVVMCRGVKGERGDIIINSMVQIEKLKEELDKQKAKA